MKLIDRFLLRHVLMPLGYCLVGFVFIYIIYDLFDNLPDFVRAGTPFRQVATYYINLTPAQLYIIVPVSMLLAVLYALSHLTKNNEITALRACGISLYRLLVPILLLGFLISITVASINEFIGPNAAYWCDQFVRGQRYIGRGQEVEIHIHRDHAHRNAIGRRNWFIREINTLTFELRDVQVDQEREDGSSERRYIAKGAKWLDGRWWFHDVEIQNYDLSSNPMGPPRSVAAREMTEFTEIPRDFLNEIRYSPDFLSSSELLRFVENNPELSDRVRARYMVDYHYRLAMPWITMVVTFMGIPFGSQTGRKGAFVGVLLCIGLFFSFWVLITFSIAAGKEQQLSPFLAGWGPNLLFLTIGLVMLYRMR